MKQTLTHTELFYRERVCEHCPGTKWGETAVCSVHQCHIGNVFSCPEWERYETGKETDSHEETEVSSLSFRQVEEDVKNYQWMVKRVRELKDSLGIVGKGVTRQYDLESGLPKPKGVKSDPVNREVRQRMRDWERLRRLEHKIKMIEDFAAGLQKEKEKEILQCMLDGWRMKAIAVHIGISRQRLNELKKRLMKKLAAEMDRSEFNG